jgi:hypothetical protein
MLCKTSAERMSGADDFNILIPSFIASDPFLRLVEHFLSDLCGDERILVPIKRNKS